MKGGAITNLFSWILPISTSTILALYLMQKLHVSLISFARSLPRMMKAVPRLSLYVVIEFRWLTSVRCISSMIEYATGECLSTTGLQKDTGERSNMTSSMAFTLPESSRRPEK